ncbi:MAG TPA: acyl-CoA reductase [Candidatus Cybelea sp.]|jgi:hypothetical protein|nr:acyl-CoA reductase [Candidatus Cybelea sp.]
MMVKSLPVRSIVDAVARAAGAWSDPGFAPRERARHAVSERMEYSLPVVDYALDRLFRSLTSDALRQAIAAELGSLDVLDRFVERAPGLFARALPLGRVCIVSSRTTIGVAIVPAIFALCAKCEVLVKDRDDRLAGAFFTTLAEIAPGLASAAARPWRGGDDERIDLAAYDCVVAFGRNTTLDEIAAALPAATRFIGYPTKYSAGYVARDALQNEEDVVTLARDAARDALLYDGEGCLSLQAIFVERGGRVTPEIFCELLVRAIEEVEARFPAVARVEGSARRAMARDLASFRGAVAQRENGDASTNALVLLDSGEAPSFAPRVIDVRSVDALAEAVDYLRRNRVGIESLAVAGATAAFELAVETGAARIAPFGSLQAPRLASLHGGRPRIAEFVRWLVDES